jgi:hypothetical protein
MLDTSVPIYMWYNLVISRICRVLMRQKSHSLRTVLMQIWGQIYMVTSEASWAVGSFSTSG